MNSALATFLQTIVDGLVLSSSISLAAVGLTLVYGITRFINFAYGEFLTYSAYFVWGVLSLGALTSAIGQWPAFVIVAVFSVAFVIVLGLAINRIAYEPLRSRGPIPLLITSIGVSFVLRYLLEGIFGSEGKSLHLPLIRPIVVGDVHISVYGVLNIIVAVIILIGVYLLLEYTLLGKKMRAVSGNETLARINGLGVQSVIRRTWIVSAGIGGLAGVFLAVRFSPFTPQLGFSFLLVIFAATILGGIGRPYGAMLGALIVGIVTSLGTRYISSSYKFAFAFAILIGVLLLKPEGIRGGEI